MSKTQKRASVAPTPAMFEIEEINIASRMTMEEVAELQRRYVEEGYSVKLLFCSSNRRVNRLREGEEETFFVYADQFRLGLHFPLCTEFAEVLNHHGIVLAQLVPNSVASIVSFIMYLRRFGIAWSLDAFHRHFFCRILPGGYVQFSTTSALRVEGMENKVRDWKSYFCRVEAVAEVDIPRKPSANRFEKPDKAVVGRTVITIDIRQYSRDERVRKKVFFPDIYGAMSDFDWASSDTALKGLVEGKLRPEKVPARKRVLRLRDVEEISGRASDLLALPSTSGAPGAEAEQEQAAEEEHLAEGAILEESAEARAAKRARMARGKRHADAPPLDSRKVRIADGGRIAIVDLSKEWWPTRLVQEGAAASLSSVLYSENLDIHMRDLSLGQLMDQTSRHQAAAWVMNDFMGTKLRAALEARRELSGRVASLGAENNRLAEENEGLTQRLQEADRRHAVEIIGLEREQEVKIKEVAAELSKRYKSEAEVLRAQNKRLKETIADFEKKDAALGDSALEENRNGVAFCLETLAKHNLLTDRKYNNIEAFEELISDDESDGASTNA